MKLVDVPVIFICPDHDEKYHARKEHMVELLTKMGFQSITHHKSGTESYPTCLVKATIDILKEHLDDDAFILLEDDVETFDVETVVHSEIDLEMPDNTDAFYLGFSKSGGHKSINSHDGWSQIEKISDKHIRILNMLSAHAILYKSKAYKTRVVDELEKVIQTPYYNDVVLARLHPEYNIYGYHYPLFYQSVTWGNPQHTQDFTKFRF